MKIFGKPREAEKELSKNSESVFDTRQEIADLKDLLDTRTRENEKTKAALEKAERAKIQAAQKTRSQIKHIQRLKKKIERIENEKAELVAENVNLKTKARNSRERANRYKNKAENGSL